MSAPYVGGLVVDAGAFGLTLVALRRLPVYLVQSVVSANLAVVAVLASLLLGASLGAADWLCVAAVAAGMVVLAASAGAGELGSLSAAGRWSLLVTAVLVTAAAAVLAGRPIAPGGPVLGIFAGLEFGVVAMAARVLPASLDPVRLLRDPAVWALVCAGVGRHAGLRHRPAARAADGHVGRGDRVRDAGAGGRGRGAHRRPPEARLGAGRGRWARARPRRRDPAGPHRTPQSAAGPAAGEPRLIVAGGGFRVVSG